ncbi:MAG TPA: ATP-binding cassette domain-containing protein [Streptosporangiaceae bacterium]|nr:ATP-binding cassette domain-containing protein [Streptosporangiaceae bacterium]
MTTGRAPRTVRWLGALLVLYLAYPLGAFAVRVIGGHNEGWNVPGLWSALVVSVEGATISVLIGVVAGIPLAYVLAHRRGWLSSAVSVVVQFPLAVPPLISGIMLIYIVGPYSFLGQLSGERLTQTMYGVVIAQSFVSAPFLVVVARSAFRAVDPSLGDVAATLGHGPLARFLRVDVPAAADGLRAGLILMWLRAFGEYGTTVVLAYHPYSLPVYVDNLFSAAPLSQAEAPTILAFGVAALAIAIGRGRRPARVRHRAIPAPLAPVPSSAEPVGFNIDATVGTFRLRVAHPEGSHRLAVVGPSGSGKSVTLRVLAGLLGPGAGTVTFGGVDVSRTAPEQRRLGYVPQGFGLLPGRTVWQQAVFGVHADPARAAWWLETLHLDGLLERLPEQLSGGERQRVSLARALAGDPQVVLLDEPFSALDTPVRAELRRELRRLQRDVNLSTVLVTHDPEEAAMLADEIVVVSDGQILQSGTCRDVYQRPASAQIGRLLGIDNLFEGAAGVDGVLVAAVDRAVSVPGGVPLGLATGLPIGARLLWQVPAEALRVRSGPSPSGANGSAVDFGLGRVADIIDLGRTVEVVVALSSGLELRARSLEMPDLTVGAACRVETDRESVSVWSEPEVAETEGVRDDPAPLV